MLEILGDFLSINCLFLSFARFSVQGFLPFLMDLHEFIAYCGY